MAETETYTVTKLAGPKVASFAVKTGQELELTEPQARAELLTGAIVKGKKGDDAVKKADPLKGSEKLPDIQARANGLDQAPAADADAKTTAGRPATPAGTAS